MKKIVVLLNAVLAWTLCLTPSTAQIKPDASMPGENSKVKTEQLVDQITGGATRGGTLFHSFEEFNISGGRSVDFVNPANINLILTRVTGGKLSNIDGTLKVSGNADLFFMNPSGIIFGPNAALDLNGSFLATTGSSFVFEDGKTFSATNPQSAPPLKISVPIGIQFGNTAKRITIETPAQFYSDLFEFKSKLQIKPGNTLSLLGGNLSFLGGGIHAPNGNIELGSVDAESFVTLNPISKGWSLRYFNVENFKDINISNGYIYNSNFNQQANNSISINARKLIIDNVTSIITNSYNNGIGGKISINTEDSISLDSSSDISSFSGIYSAGADIEINTGSLYISDSGSIHTGTESESYRKGNKGGDININSANLFIKNEGKIRTSAYNYGDAGNINIQVSNNISIDGRQKYPDNYFNNPIYIYIGSTGISSTSDWPNDGHNKSGSININSNNLFLTNGGQIRTSASNSGMSGNINIQVSNNISIDGREKFPRYYFDKPIHSHLDNSGIFSTSSGPYEGYKKGGDINISSNNLSLTDGGQIHTSSYYSNAGNINIKASNKIYIDGHGSYYFDNSIYSHSGIFSTSYESLGKTGNLSLISKDIDIRNNAEIGVISKRNGPTGFLNIEGENLTLDNNAYISMKGINNRLGNLNIDIDNLLLMENQSEITYKTEGQGIGGKANIDAPMIIAFPNENSDIIIDAPKVDVSITGKEVLGLTKRPQQTKMSDLVVDSEDDRELVGEYGRTSKLKVSEFKGIPVQPKKIVKGCRPGQALGNGRFVYKHRGGIPPTPYELESAPAIWQDLRPHAVITEVSLESSNRAEPNQKLNQNIKLQQESIPKQPEIVEAQGWTRDATGHIVLTAQTSKLIAHKTEQPSAAC